MLIENQLDRFTASMLREERSPATVEKYRREAAAFLRWLEGREPDG